VERILSIARKHADAAEVFQVNSHRTPVQFEANRLKQIQTKESTATAIRIVKNGRIGFAQASGKIDPDELVKMALDTSQFGYEVNFEFPSSQTYRDVEVYDKDI
jgi:PmbA protein